MKTRKILPILAASVLVLAAAAPVAAGVHYQATTSVEGEGRPQVTEVEAWVDGPRAKVLFRESSQPMLEDGQYLLTQDGGKTIYLVDPKEKTYGEWDMEAMLQLVGGVIEGLGPLLDLEFSDPEVEKLAEEPGGEVAGQPTTHYRYRTAYTTKVKVLGMKRESHTETIQDVWSTTALDDDVALGLWLRKQPVKTGNEGIDRVIAAEVEKIRGFPLKTVAVSTTTGGKRGEKTSTTRTTTEVTSLAETDVPAATFELPAGYAEQQMMPEGGDEEEARSPFDVFRRRGGDDDGGR